MAIEQKRLCGYRKVGGLYLVGEGIIMPCDRLPLPITVCPACGAGIKVTRNLTQINPARLWGRHEPTCCCPAPRACLVCNARHEVGFIIGVGKSYYTPQQFISEAMLLGVSKRIPQVPRQLRPKVTPVYLAHRQAILLGLDNGKPRYQSGVIYAFIPKCVEWLLWESQITPVAKAEAVRRGVRIVAIPDGDQDHA